MQFFQVILEEGLTAINAFGNKIKKSIVRERRVRTKRRVFFPNEGIYCPEEGLGKRGFNLIWDICWVRVLLDNLECFQIQLFQS